MIGFYRYIWTTSNYTGRILFILANVICATVIALLAAMIWVTEPFRILAICAGVVFTLLWGIIYMLQKADEYSRSGN